ncbi:MAG: DNA repair protein RadC [Burkholderiaceae bacterium]|jgi:DNA repair protein RadC|nr:DNA repair protein RadC [Burkholderiaceae bacterium]
MSLKSLPASTRPRERLLVQGPAALADAELLALVLRTGISGCDVLQLSQQLLERFGGVAGLLGASLEELKTVRGLGGTAKRAQLSAVLELARRALTEQLKAQPVLGSAQEVQQFLQLHLAGQSHEVFGVLLLDAQHRLIRFEALFRGTLTQTSVYPREIVQLALTHGAAAVVLAHNHPSGSAEPSHADATLTRTLQAALGLIDVRVIDHVIVAPGLAVSMTERGLI